MSMPLFSLVAPRLPLRICRGISCKKFLRLMKQESLGMKKLEHAEGQVIRNVLNKHRGHRNKAAEGTGNPCCHIVAQDEEAGDKAQVALMQR